MGSGLMLLSLELWGCKKTSFKILFCILALSKYPFLILQAGKFGIVPTIINLAAALALLSLVSWSVGEKQERSAEFRVFPPSQVPPVTDWVMLTFMRKRDLYKRHKVSVLMEDPDTESVNHRSLSPFLLTDQAWRHMFVCFCFYYHRCCQWDPPMEPKSNAVISRWEMFCR